MRGFGLFFGAPRRNEPVRLVDPHPIPKLDDAVHSGNRFRDGYTLLSRAQPDRQGSPPPVAGTRGPARQGPDDSFEQ